MSDKAAPFIDPDETDNDGRSITARWNQGEPNAEGWQRQSRLTVTHYVRRGYRAIVMNSEVRSDEIGRAEKLGVMQYAVVVDVATNARFSAQRLANEYTNALSELRRKLNDGDATLAAYFPQQG